MKTHRIRQLAQSISYLHPVKMLNTLWLRHLVVLHLLIIGLISSNHVFAHTLNQTAAQVILRDGQIELRLYVNMENWLARLQDHQAWLTGEHSLLLAEEDIHDPGLSDRLAQLLEKESQIQLNHTRISLSTTAVDDNTDPGHRTEFRFSGSHSIVAVSSLEISFPHSLGEVHLSVAQPIYENVTQGESQKISLNTR
ncbi:hypothetical protein AB4259_00440 [Vibrio amylolyticus]|uniref:hypothetical protein n=1 Tax=Vibrio amylolyticus TaxID=2847292 RepID=UPI00355208A0